MSKSNNEIARLVDRRTLLRGAGVGAAGIIGSALLGAQRAGGSTEALEADPPGQQRVTVVLHGLSATQTAQVPGGVLHVYTEPELMITALRTARPEVFCTAWRDGSHETYCGHGAWEHRGGRCVRCFYDHRDELRSPWAEAYRGDEPIRFAHAFTPGVVCLEQHPANGDPRRCRSCHGDGFLRLPVEGGEPSARVA